VEERQRLRQLLRRSSTTALQQRRARILLTVDGGGRHAPTDAAAAATQVDPRTVARVREAFAHGLERALNGRTPVFPPRRKLSDLQEAQVLVLAQAEPPPGHARWSLRLLANRLVELDVVDGISPETVRATLKKTISSPGGCAPGRPCRPTLRALPRRWRMCWPSMCPAGRSGPAAGLLRRARHSTSTHGSWLNLAAECGAWVAARNASATPITWRFTLEAARIRLAHVYPKVEHGTIARTLYSP
jgi:hypothetical protein